MQSHKGSVWFHNPLTGEQRRLNYGDEIPEGFIPGRCLFPNYPFMGNRLDEEKLKEHREIMRPYYELYLKEHKRGKYRNTGSGKKPE